MTGEVADTLEAWRGGRGWEHVELYDTAHLIMLAVFLAGIWPALLLGRRERRSGGVSATSRLFALAIPGFTVPFQVIDLLLDFEIDVTLPLHLCDLAWVAAAAALWTHHRFPVALTYFWGLVLTTQGILTPSLGEDFPHPRFFAFWGMHLLIVWAAIYLVWGVGISPRWRDYAAAIAATAVWAVGVFCFNLAADTNYGYLQRKPSTGSVLDYLGPWPWYLLAEVAIIAAVWALMTWPWERRRVHRPGP